MRYGALRKNIRTVVTAYRLRRARWRSDVPSGSQTPRSLRVLVVDGYSDAQRRAFDDIGMPQASSLYSSTLTRNAPPNVKLENHILYPCVPSYVPPSDDEIQSFDGIAYTGSSFSAYDEDDDVTRQITLMQRAFDNGVSCFGSCWGIQVATMALGGDVQLNPRGREAGVGRNIGLTPEGRAHSMFEGKNDIFSAWMSHSDEVTALPDGAVLLASNAHSNVQAMAVKSRGVESWFVQYHPEYTLQYIAKLFLLRKDRMQNLGFFRDNADAEAYVADLLNLSKNANRKDIAWRYGIDDDLLVDAMKERELSNWLKYIMERKVVPAPIL